MQDANFNWHIYYVYHPRFWYKTASIKRDDG